MSELDTFERFAPSTSAWRMDASSSLRASGPPSVAKPWSATLPDDLGHVKERGYPTAGASAFTRKRKERGRPGLPWAPDASTGGASADISVERGRSSRLMRRRWATSPSQTVSGRCSAGGAREAVCGLGGSVFELNKVERLDGSGVAGSEVGSHRLSKYSASCKSIVSLSTTLWPCLRHWISRPRWFKRPQGGHWLRGGKPGKRMLRRKLRFGHPLVRSAPTP